jgi:hypothetical protein
VALAPADGHRFLFIVDMSEDMESLKDPLEATIYDLIRSGLYGQMQSGDTFGLWTFDKLPHAGKFPVQVWDARKATSIGAIAAAHLSNHHYDKSADLKPVTELLMTVIQAVTNLNVFIISDGDTAMRGTPFDKAINAEYKKKRRERSSAKRPFVTTLIARDSQIVSNSVVIAGQQIVLPARPLPPAINAKNTVPAPYRPAGVLLSNTGITAIVSSTALQTPLASAPVTTNAAAITEPPSNAVAKSKIPAGAVIQIITKSNNAPAVIERTSPEPSDEEVALASESAPANNRSLEPPHVADPPAPGADVPEPQENAPPHDALAAILSAPITVAARERHPEPETISPVPPAAASVAALAVPPVLGAGQPDHTVDGTPLNVLSARDSSLTASPEVAVEARLRNRAQLSWWLRSAVSDPARIWHLRHTPGRRPPVL